ncbi:hypothetical protein EJB05_14883 [Eragrostis curvula]|uniref:Uncharacterized protein n=1 Tax=Eragrostis curvula TaxID=38414 RepID=A0A5J9W0E9_9POAL|nr:hypothetical protein EJB05_14883 [Eragrostis curvula]
MAQPLRPPARLLRRHRRPPLRLRHRRYFGSSALHPRRFPFSRQEHMAPGNDREHGGGRGDPGRGDRRVDDGPVRSSDVDPGGGLPLLRGRGGDGVGAGPGAAGGGPRLRGPRRGHGVHDRAAVHLRGLAGADPRRARQHQRLPHHRRPVPVLPHQPRLHKGPRHVALDARRRWTPRRRSVRAHALPPRVAQVALQEGEGGGSGGDSAADLLGGGGGARDRGAEGVGGGGAGFLVGEEGEPVEGDADVGDGASRAGRRRGAAGVPAAGGHQHGDVLQPVDRAAGRVRVEPDGAGAVAGDLGPQRARLRRQHLLHRPRRPEEAAGRQPRRRRPLARRPHRRLPRDRLPLAARRRRPDPPLRRLPHLPRVQTGDGGDRRILGLHAVPQGVVDGVRLLRVRRRRQAPPRRVPGVERDGARRVRRRGVRVLVHARVPEPVRLAGTGRARALHHLLLPRDGHRAVDRQLGDLPAAVPRRVRRRRRHGQLGVQPRRRAVVPLAHPGHRHVLDVPHLWRVVRGGARVRARLRAGDQGAAHRGGGEDARETGAQAQVLGDAPRRRRRWRQGEHAQGRRRLRETLLLFISFRSDDHLAAEWM